MQTQQDQAKGKSTPMLLVERLYPGKTIDVIVREAVDRHGRLEAAAAELGVSLGTMRKWKKRFAEEAVAA